MKLFLVVAVERLGSMRETLRLAERDVLSEGTPDPEEVEQSAPEEEEHHPELPGPEHVGIEVPVIFRSFPRHGERTRPRALPPLGGRRETARGWLVVVRSSARSTLVEMSANAANAEVFDLAFDRRASPEHGLSGIARLGRGDHSSRPARRSGPARACRARSAAAHRGQARRSRGHGLRSRARERRRRRSGEGRPNSDSTAVFRFLGRINDAELRTATAPPTAS
jgi:hypothetical protein